MSSPASLKHVAIIMDGNGRWAQSRHHPRIWGHVRGAKVVSSIIEKADALGVQALTLYAFSTENWSRPINEVSTLIKLLRKFLLKEEKRILENNISFKVIGETETLPDTLKELIRSLETKTENASGLKLTFAFSYGGRQEIISAINKCNKNYPNQVISEEMLSEHLYRPETGDVDLLIRTGGDFRISNFLLWQMAYAELYFTETKWPDFTTAELENIITDFNNRERRFGSIDKKHSLGDSKISSLSNRGYFLKTNRLENV